MLLELLIIMITAGAEVSVCQSTALCTSPARGRGRGRGGFIFKVLFIIETWSHPPSSLLYEKWYFYQLKCEMGLTQQPGRGTTENCKSETVEQLVLAGSDESRAVL